MSVIEARLKELGVTLPTPPVPVASYVPCTITGNLVFVSGQIPIADGAIKYVGKLGVDVPMEAGCSPPCSAMPASMPAPPLASAPCRAGWRWKWTRSSRSSDRKTGHKCV